MEILLVSPDSIKIKGKYASVIIDPPVDGAKNSADAVVFMQQDRTSTIKVDEHRLVIDGAGEYEIGQIKITGFRFKEGRAYEFNVDGISILLVSSETLKNAQGIGKDYKIVVVKSDSNIDASAITALAPRVTVFYGKNATVSAKELGKEPQVTSKYQITYDKLPEEMAVVVLE